MSDICLSQLLSLKICQASGFFYQSDDNNIWLVTNKHVLYHPKYLDDNTREWEYSSNINKNCNITMFDLRTKNEKDLSLWYLDELKAIENRIKYHNNPYADVILLSIKELFNQQPTNRDEAWINHHYQTSLNYYLFNKSNIFRGESIDNLDICTIGFPQVGYAKVPSRIEGKIINHYYDNKSNLTMAKINKEFYEGYSGSPVFLLESIEKFKKTKKYEDIVLVGIVIGCLLKDKQGIFGDISLVEEILDS